MATRTLAAVLTLAAGAAASADELWRQDPLGSYGGLSSQDARNPGGLGWFSEVVDNFEADAAWTIEDVEFWGGYASLVPGNTHGFTIRIYQNNAGQVGTLLFMQDVMTFTETQYYTAPLPPPFNFPGYHNTLSLSPSYTLPAAGSYWISVVAILDRGGTANEPQWGWNQAGGGTPPACMQWFFAPGQFSPQGQEVAFVLNGTAGTTCYPDCNNSGTLTVADFTCFQGEFLSQTAYGDCNQSGTWTAADFTCFQTAYLNGCP